MAKIPLRTYLQEIERLVDSQRIEEAVAHSRHILQLYPKYVDVYRVLGKAYLEAKRYGDAADIFQRVLSSLPEDFVSNAGMSIIREDEGNLEEAIWHMERAFEIEPSNSTIQDELRRLIGKRDGLEPPRIRLTRGALARMYIKGDLIHEAITEIRIALTEDADRLDLRALLAVALHRVGQRVEAIEAANQVLRKLPNNLDANRIMAELLAGTERDAEAQEYRNVVVELDPYFNFVTPSTPVASQVPGQAVSIEKLEWKAPPMPAEVSLTPGWAAVPAIQVVEPNEPEAVVPEEEVPEEVVPENLSTHQEVFGPVDMQAEEKEIPGPSILEAQENQEIPIANTAPPVSETTPEPQEEIPDWMLAAGWIPISAAAASQGESQEPSAREQGEPAEEDFEQAAPVWLAENMPETETHIESEIDATSSEEALPEWVFEQEPAFTAENELPPWLSEAAVEQQPASSTEGNAQPGSTEGLPEWLFVEETPASEQARPDAEIPAWLMDDASATDSSTARETLPEDSTEVPIPTWLFEAASPDEGLQQDEGEISPVEAAAALTGAKAVVQAFQDSSQQEPEGTTALSEPALTVSAETDVEASTPASPPMAPEKPQVKPATTLKLPAWLLVSREIDKTPAASEQETAPGYEAPMPPLEGSEQPELAATDEEESIPAWLLDEDLQIPETPVQEITPKVEQISGAEEIPEWLSMIAEPALSEEDTKPTKVEKAVEVAALSEAVQPETHLEGTADSNALPPAWLLAALAENEIEERIQEPAEEGPEAEAQVTESQPTTDQVSVDYPEWLLAEEVLSTTANQEPAPLNLQTDEQPAELVVMPGAIEEQVINEVPPGAGMDESIPVPPEAALRAEIMAQEILDEPEDADEPLEMLEEIDDEITADMPTDEMPEWLITPVEDKAAIFGWTPPPVPPTEYVNLNSASLVEIEKLPGMGFIRAQNIVNYREYNGHFTNLEELEKVPGITSDIIESIKDYVYVEKSETELPQKEEPAEEIHPEGVMPEELLLARSALVQDEIDPALAGYTKFIEAYQYLPEIILDLKEAVNRHPENPDLWLSLGDAYIRSNQVQSALEAYRSAEKLLI